MKKLAYTITGTFSDSAVAEEWIGWLRSQQIGEMLACGACDAQIARMDHPQSVAQVRYEFASRNAFNMYQLNHGPRLRTLMLSKFPPDHGACFEYTIGAIDDGGDLNSTRQAVDHATA